MSTEGKNPVAFFTSDVSPQSQSPPRCYVIPESMPDTIPAELVADHHQEPTLDDPSAKVEWWSNFGSRNPANANAADDQGRTQQKDTFPHCDIPAQMFYTIHPELIPDHHQEPTLDEPSARVEWWSSPPKRQGLTDADEGILRQKANRNVTEMADGILGHYKTLSIGGRLYIYEPPCWRLIDGDDLMEFISAAANRIFPKEAPFLDEGQRREISRQLLYQSKKLKKIPSINHNYLCCQDYMYDWHTGKCISHQSSYHRFFALDMDAKDIGNCEGRYWEKFLNDLTGGDPALRQRILEVIGVILTGYPAKAFFLLQGDQHTGKSQLVNFIRNLLGESACFALNDVSQLGDKWTTGSLWGKLLCLCGDMPDEPLSRRAIGTIKQLTGDDLIRGELKYKNAFTFENTAKLLFASNHPLQIPNVQREQALLARLVDIPCRNSISKEDQIPQLYQHLLDEAGYIVGLAMDVLRDFEARNDIFTPIAESMEEGTICVPDADQSIMDFVRDCCVLEADAQCPVSEMFDAYCSYEPEDDLNKKQLTQLLTHCFPGVKTFRTKKERGYKGIRLADNPSN